MKRLGVAFFMAMMFAFQVNAQDTVQTASASDSTRVLEATSDSTVEMVEKPAMQVMGKKDPYYVAADQRFSEITSHMESRENYWEARQDKIIYGRIWVIIILVAFLAIQGGLGFMGYKDYEENEKPVIFNIWPQTTADKTHMNLYIPGHSFMAELTVFNKQKESVFKTNIDNAASEVELDLSDLPAGKYKVQLIGEKNSSNKVDLTLV